MQKVAFFDIDGTVFRSSLLIELIEALVDAEIFPETARTAYQKEFHAWRNREGSYEAYAHAVVASFLQHIKGVFYGDFADIGRKVVAAQGKRVYRYTRDLIASLQRDGYYVVAISQSPKTVLDEFCMAHGFDKVYGRIYELGPQDRFTGVVSDEHLIENKANIIKRVGEQDGITLQGSIGVGDTDGDIPLLESVENPICFNPNKKLHDYATQMGWKIVVERKDVIYE
ncbi:HAD-IB family hydrolase [Candidatus Parcubacteria bacterium]|uniref:phosphoserine phosphatase n=1 Tax=Candidatus Kaiserbacteria bacterium CG10_big_fil_rev_8_21_14_0_10_47_16 TaxID=1974608 RepID=A0A2H0UDF9_9BACT|nr:HAD-IB family hydrolase [Candidatus Parcubacteria bacterium]PIR84390.1 MAG: HAD-IB family hydrolase [Candidatus Kaiserbacteria bacterium CG10_big_fil_rev_8_21_14_0_10_47_16]